MMLLPGCAVATAAPLLHLTPALAQVATTLFTIPAVHALYFGPDFVTVTRARTSAAAGAWDESLKDQIVAHLDKFCKEQEQQLQVREAERLDSSALFDDPTEALIVDIIETQVKTHALISCSILCVFCCCCTRFPPLPLHALMHCRCGRWCKKTAGTSCSSAGMQTAAPCGC